MNSIKFKLLVFLFTIFTLILNRLPAYDYGSKYLLVYECPGFDSLLFDCGNDFEALEKSVSYLVTPGYPWIIVSSENVPDPKWQKAWRIEKEKVVVDMVIARKMHMSKIRILRNLTLEDLDVEMIRSLETDDTKARKRIGKKKQFLRDLPQHLDLSIFETLAELDNFIPEEVYQAYQYCGTYLDAENPDSVLNNWKKRGLR